MIKTCNSLATKDVETKLNADCHLHDLKTIYNLMTLALRNNREKTVELPGWGQQKNGWALQLSSKDLWLRILTIWRSGLCKVTNETALAFDEVVNQKLNNEAEKWNKTNRGYVFISLIGQDYVSGISWMIVGLQYQISNIYF